MQGSRITDRATYVGITVFYSAATARPTAASRRRRIRRDDRLTMMTAYEARLIAATLTATGRSATQAMKHLKISRKTFYIWCE